MSTPSDQDPFGGPQPSGQQPPYGQPEYGQPYGQPQFGQPYGQPQYGEPPYGAPASGGPVLAHWGLRVGSALIDGLIGAVIAMIFVIPGGALRSDSPGLSSLLVAVGYLAALAFAIWNYARQGRTGQTVGKQVVGTRLVREADGRYVGAGLSIGRAFLHVIDSLPCYLGYLWPIWDQKRQTFADKILRTVVVKG